MYLVPNSDQKTYGIGILLILFYNLTSDSKFVNLSIEFLVEYNM